LGVATLSKTEASACTVRSLSAAPVPRHLTKHLF
jgi:hypothetical protein